MAPFFGVEKDEPAGFLATPAWRLLSQDLTLADGTTFFRPNPGVLYPAVYDLAERVLAAAKAARPFDQTEQAGWRCALTGETEWLTTDPVQLQKSYRQQTDTLWARVAKTRPAWARKGEHLGALPAVKRLWPTLFAEEVERALGSDVKRFVVSTHTMALAHQLGKWMERGGLMPSEPTRDSRDFSEACARLGVEPVALPRRLARRQADRRVVADAKRMVGLLEAAREAEDEQEYERARRLVEAALASGREDGKKPRLETYYALVQMDGDHMGAWLSGGEDYAIRYRESFHPQVQQGFAAFAARHDAIQRYGDQPRALSPSRHLAISGALNDFSLTLVRHVVEEEHLGRVIYAGGDDVLAMLPVADLLAAMERLRQAYSGVGEARDAGDVRLVLDNGFALMETRGGGRRQVRLMRTMGARATASCGAVIAHHQAPLGAVLRELREAERRAKTYARPGADGRLKDRDAFSLTVIKRSGGALRLSADWGEPVTLLADLRRFLADPGVSRRAVYHSLEWLADLPEPEGEAEMLVTLLGYQLARQASEGARKYHDVPTLARRLSTLALAQPRNRLQWLANFLTVAEFLARETRAGDEA